MFSPCVDFFPVSGLESPKQRTGVARSSVGKSRQVSMSAMEKQFERSYRSLSDLFDFVDLFGSREDLDGAARYTVSFAVEELFTNSVKYNPGNEREIVVRLSRTGERLTIRVIDFDVEPFDIRNAESAPIDVPLKQREAGGLGLHLLRQMMDDIDYDYSDRRSTITLTKNLR